MFGFLFHIALARFYSVEISECYKENSGAFSGVATVQMLVFVNMGRSIVFPYEAFFRGKEPTAARNLRF